MHPSQAAAEVARRRVKRAAGLLREAASDLAAAVDGPTPVGVMRVHDVATARDALALIEVGAARHGAVDVLVIPRPTGRERSTPPMAPTGAKEITHGTEGP